MSFDIIVINKTMDYIMQIMSVQIQDEYVNDFMNYVNNHCDRITITKDKNSDTTKYRKSIN